MEDKWLNEWQKKLDGYEATPRAVGRDKQGFGRAMPVRLLLSWKAYRMASPGWDSGGVGDRCALGKKRMPAGFYVSCRKAHSNRRHSSGAVGCLLGKSPESEKGIISW